MQAETVKIDGEKSQSECWICDSLILGAPLHLILNYDLTLKHYETISLCSDLCYHDALLNFLEKFDLHLDRPEVRNIEVSQPTFNALLDWKRQSESPSIDFVIQDLLATRDEVRVDARMKTE